MSVDLHANFAYSTVANAPGSSGTSLTVQSGKGALFNTPPFNCTVWPSGVQALSTNAEIVRVTAISGDTFTITRTQEGTSAQNITAGYQISNSITVKTFTDIEGAVASNTAAIAAIDVDIEPATFTTPGIVNQTVFNVMNYGAVGDGSTDDSTAINNALAAASAAGGGIVQLAAKHYISTSIVPASNVWLRGMGVNATIIYPSTTNTGANGDAIRLAIATTSAYGFRVTISDMTIDCSAQYPSGQYGSVPGTYSNGLTLQGIDDLRIENVRVIKPFGFGADVGSTGGGAPFVKRPIIKNLYVEGERGGFDSLGGGGITNPAVDGLYVYPASDGTNPYGTVNNWTNLIGGSFKNIRGYTTFINGALNSNVTPSLPPGATPLLNPYPFPVTITITGTLTACTINGVSQSLTGPYTLPGFGQISISYPTTPTWVWSAPTAPSVPASTVNATNPFAFPVPVTITGGTVTAVNINGTTQSGTSGYFLVPVSGTISITYSVAPTWSWATVAPSGGIESDFGAQNISWDSVYLNGFKNGYVVSNVLNRQTTANLSFHDITIINVGFHAFDTNVSTGYGISGIKFTGSNFIDKWGMTSGSQGFIMNGSTHFLLEGIKFGIPANASYCIDLESDGTNSCDYGSVAFNDMSANPSNTLLAGSTGTNVTYFDNKGFSTKGTGTLSSGTTTINNSVVNSSSQIFLTPTSKSANSGILTQGTITAGTSFVVNSTNSSDANTFNWWIIN